jgi:hypothetical protein
MYKVCLNDSNNIIGFDLKNSNYYINLFDINNVTKNIKEYKEEQVRDSLGRKMYYQYNTLSDITSITYIIDNDSKYTYTPITTLVPVENNVLLVSDTDKFTLSNLIHIKKEQLKNINNCKDCILYELLDDSMLLTFNTNIGKNIIKLYSNSETISNRVALSNNSKIAIYYEADNDLNIAISSDEKKWINVEKNQFIDYTEEQLFIKFSSTNETNIESIAVLIN